LILIKIENDSNSLQEGECEKKKKTTANVSRNSTQNATGSQNYKTEVLSFETIEPQLTSKSIPTTKAPETTTSLVVFNEDSEYTPSLLGQQLGVVEDNADNFLESHLSVQNLQTISFTPYSALPEYVLCLFCFFFLNFSLFWRNMIERMIVCDSLFVFMFFVFLFVLIVLIVL
jgi:hypothetical protein